VYTVFTDACDTGAAGVYQGDFFYVNFDLDWQRFTNHHINYKEILAIILAAYRWGPLWAGKRICVYTDSMVALAAINKSKCKCPRVLRGLHLLFWLSVMYNFKISAHHLSGTKNVEADMISRIADPVFCNQFVQSYPIHHVNLCKHMSYSCVRCFFGGGHFSPEGIG